MIPNITGSAIVDGALLAAIAVFVLVGGRFLAALARDDTDVEDAWELTSASVAAVVTGAFMAGTSGLVATTDAIGGVFAFFGAHPFASSNVGIAALGALVADGFLNLSAEQVLAGALIIAGVTMIAYRAAGADDAR